MSDTPHEDTALDLAFDRAMQIMMDAGFSAPDDDDIATASVGQDARWVETYLGWRVEADYTITVINADDTVLEVMNLTPSRVLNSRALFDMTPRGLRWFDAAISSTITQGAAS